jgi:hypothetical protein
MTKSVDIVRPKRYFQNPCGYIDQEVSTRGYGLKNVYTKNKTHLVLSILVTPTSIATSSTMAQSRRYCPSWTISPNSKLTNRSSGKYMVVVCKMYTRYQELTLFCGSGVPLPSIATSSAMTQSRLYRPSWTIFPKSMWIHRSSGK